MLSFKTNVYKNEWLDLVFAKRNQLYGAYELRREYPARLTTALLISAGLFISAVSGPFLYNRFHREEAVVQTKEIPVQLSPDQIYKMPKTEEPKKEAAAPKKVESTPVKVATIKHVTPQVVPQNDPMIAEMPTIDQLEDAVIATETSAGELAAKGTNSLPTEGTGTGKGTQAGTGDGEEIILTAEKSPEFPGGMDAFARFIQKNLRYPAKASDAQITGRVIISFVVEKNGSISNVTVLKGIGFGCDEEAMRVLKKVPNWIPGEQNGRKVRVQYTVPLMFQMTE